MATKYTAEEKAALIKKEKDPKITVVCPRCGKELVYYEIGNSYKIECKTPGCIVMRVRGL